MRKSPKRYRAYIAGVIICGLLALFQQNIFRIREVSAAGSDRDFSTEIQSLHLENSPVIFVPYSAIRRHLLQGDPGLADVRFGFHFPGYISLEVEAVPREPLAVLDLVSRKIGPALCVDDTGALFAMKNAPAGLKSIRIQGKITLTPGERLPPQVKAAVCKLADLMRQTDWIFGADLSFEPGGECTLKTRRGIRIDAGPLAGLSSRLDVIPPLLSLIRKQGIKAVSINLMNADSPVIKVAQR